MNKLAMREKILEQIMDLFTGMEDAPLASEGDGEKVEMVSIEADPELASSEGDDMAEKMKALKAMKGC